jgi:hypothetical protein
MILENLARYPFSWSEISFLIAVFVYLASISRYGFQTYPMDENKIEVR